MRWTENPSETRRAFAEINKLRNVSSCWLYSENVLATHGLMNVKFISMNLTKIKLERNMMQLRNVLKIFVILFIHKTQNFSSTEYLLVTAQSIYITQTFRIFL